MEVRNCSGILRNQSSLDLGRLSTNSSNRSFRSKLFSAGEFGNAGLSSLSRSVTKRWRKDSVLFAFSWPQDRL